MEAGRRCRAIVGLSFLLTISFFFSSLPPLSFISSSPSMPCFRLPHPSLLAHAFQAICFRAVNSISDVSSEACVQVAVNRCSWSVNQGQTLAEIATIFGSNFVQMWALNPDLVSPDSLLIPGTSISVGHLYTVRSTDNIRYLNVQFATTRATIELLNFDLKAAISALSQPLGDKDPLAFWSGRQVCILPHSCVDTLGKAA
mmetsp:Transcript_48667/g.152787  ORF Transcript_48667/g.152787 Transcript_48667/m.152787 type:complete len:200 (-) Transcript_48667:29-628(-)